MIRNWTVDYGDGPQPCSIPHAWKQDVPVYWEGPAVYSCEVDVPDADCVLRFHGVSYSAHIFVQGEFYTEHLGIWDAFDVALLDWGGKTIRVDIHVTKNGGPSYPVRDVASGFLPFVFHTFGGIFRNVELIVGNPSLEQPVSANPYSLRGEKIIGPNGPIYPRGLLHWGWYPELGHATPIAEVIEREVLEAKNLGFNLVKFCLWVPPHQYFEILSRHDMFAWLELPLWDPTPDPECQEQIARELEAIVRQFCHHKCILFWTIGCELSKTTSADYRKRLYEMVKGLTESPLVTDNSGGAEMYGGDPREFGDFYDFHPYCDTPFYPLVLDLLLPGPRESKPTMLGEFNDIDIYRDLSVLAETAPYWASESEDLNAQGARWNHDLPTILRESSLSKPGSELRNEVLVKSSTSKAAFMRKFVQEAVRSRASISGYVVTGWRDTPISTAGVFDDFGIARFEPDQMLKWNGDDCLFLIPQRRPPWIRGGNRAGWVDPYNCAADSNLWKFGCHSSLGTEAQAKYWIMRKTDGAMMTAGHCPIVSVGALHSQQIGECFAEYLPPGDYSLIAEFGDTNNEWLIWIPENLGLTDWDEFEVGQFERVQFESRCIHFLTGKGTIPMPFWRESAYEFAKPGCDWHDAFFNEFADKWERFLPISPDCALDISSLPKDVEVLMNRIDVRTMKEHPILVRGFADGIENIWTTLRPFGGLGIQPVFKHNPAGRRLFAILAGI